MQGYPPPPGSMKRKTILALGIVAMMLMATLIIVAVRTAVRESDESMLHVHLMSSMKDTNGIEVVGFTVTNANSKAFPWFATATPDGQSPYYVIETKTKAGWSRTTPFTNYWFTHHLLPNTSWEFPVSLGASDRPRRLIFFYSVGQRAQPWFVDKMHNLLKNLTLEKDQHELRSAIIGPDMGEANGRLPVAP